MNRRLELTGDKFSNYWEVLKCHEDGSWDGRVIIFNVRVSASYILHVYVNRFGEAGLNTLNVMSMEVRNLVNIVWPHQP